MITWKQIEYSIIVSKLFDTEIDNKFYHDVLEYYFSDISLFIKSPIELNKKYYKNGMYISHHDSEYIVLSHDFEVFIKSKYCVHSNLSRIINRYIKYKHGLNIRVL